MFGRPLAGTTMLYSPLMCAQEEKGPHARDAELEILRMPKDKLDIVVMLRDKVSLVVVTLCSRLAHFRLQHFRMWSSKSRIYYLRSLA